MYIFNLNGEILSIDKLLKSNPKVWNIALYITIGKSAQGIMYIKGNNAVDFVSYEEVPENKKVAYANMICDHRPLKSEKDRVQLTVNGMF